MHASRVLVLALLACMACSLVLATADGYQQNTAGSSDPVVYPGHEARQAENPAKPVAPKAPEYVRQPQPLKPAAPKPSEEALADTGKKPDEGPWQRAPEQEPTLKRRSWLSDLARPGEGGPPAADSYPAKPVAPKSPEYVRNPQQPGKSAPPKGGEEALADTGTKPDAGAWQHAPPEQEPTPKRHSRREFPGVDEPEGQDSHPARPVAPRAPEHVSKPQRPDKPAAPREEDDEEEEVADKKWPGYSREVENKKPEGAAEHTPEREHPPRRQADDHHHQDHHRKKHGRPHGRRWASPRARRAPSVPSVPSVPPLPPAPRCSAITASLPAIANASWPVGGCANAAIAQTCAASCDTANNFTGPGFTATCLANATWSPVTGPGCLTILATCDVGAWNIGPWNLNNIPVAAQATTRIIWRCGSDSGGLNLGVAFTWVFTPPGGSVVVNASTPVTSYLMADNVGDVFVNGTLLYSTGPYCHACPTTWPLTLKKNFTLPAGASDIKIVAANAGVGVSPAGMLFVIERISDGAILLKTDGTWMTAAAP